MALDNVLHAIREVFAIALQRPGDRLSRPPGLRPRRRRAVGRRAADGAQRPRRRRRDVHARHRVGLRPGRLHHRRRTVSARPSCRARSTPTSSTSTSRTSRRGARRSCARAVGGKALKMVFADGARARHSRPRPSMWPRPSGSASRSPMPKPRSSRRHARRHRAALRPADGHRMGPRRRRRQALHPAGAAGNREVARGSRRQLAPLPLENALRRARERPRDRPEDRRRARCALVKSRGRNGSRQAPATCWSPT